MLAIVSGMSAPTVLVSRRRLSVADGVNGELGIGSTGFYQMITPVNGVLRIGIGNSHELSIYGPDDVLFLAPQESVRIEAHESVRMCYVAFIVRASRLIPGDGLDLRIAPGEPHQPSPEAWWGCSIPPFLPASLARGCAADIRLIADVWWRGAFGRLRSSGILMGILERLVVSVTSDEPSVRPLGSTLNERLRRTIDAAIEHPGSFKTVSDMARASGWSRNHFTQLFTDQAGVPPAKWLRRIRLQKVEELLINSNLGLSAIAVETGFSSSSALCTVFRAEHECTPGVWREHYRQIQNRTV